MNHSSPILEKSIQVIIIPFSDCRLLDGHWVFSEHQGEMVGKGKLPAEDEALLGWKCPEGRA